RVIAQYADLPRPFRRYQVSSVWRADKPDKGRFREFTQFDLDSVGTESEIADTEIIAGMCDTLAALRVGRALVRFSSRSILNLVLDFAGVPQERSGDVFRVLDKLEKAGMEKVRLELMHGYKDESVFGGGRYDNLVMRFLGERIPAVGASIGVDRLLAALAHLGAIGTRKATARVLVTNIDATLTEDYLQMTWQLRRAGIPTELY